MPNPLPYRFLISASVDTPAENLDVLCHSERDAIEAANMFSEGAASVELWQGERRVWPSAH